MNMQKLLKLALFEPIGENLKNMVVVREASFQDSSEILSIRNHPENVKWFFKEEVVTEEEHALWFASRLTELRFFTLVAELDNQIVGIAYLKDFELKSPRISISVKPGSKEQGVGSQLLDELILRARMTNLKALLAEIKIMNTSSLRFFSHNGFIKIDTAPSRLANNAVEIITLILNLT